MLIFNVIIRTMKHLRLILLALIFQIPIFPGGEGKTTVTTSGTPVQLYVTQPPTTATICTVTALSTNTGTIWFGFDSNVSAANKQGTPLGPPITAGQPGATYSCLPVGNSQSWALGAVWLDSTNSGEGVSFSWK